MNVSEMIEWLKTFDPNTQVEVIETEAVDVETTLVREMSFENVERQSSYFDFTDPNDYVDPNSEFGKEYNGKKVLLLGVKD